MHACSRSARRDEQSRRRGERRVHQPARERVVSRLPRHMARRLTACRRTSAYDFEATSAAIEANRESYGVAWPRVQVQRREADRLVRRRLPRRHGARRFRSSSTSPTPARSSTTRRASSTSVRVARSPASTPTSGSPCKPGTELAIANALRGQGLAPTAAQQSGVAARQLLTRARAARSRAAKPALVARRRHAARTRSSSRSPSPRSTRRRRRRHDDPARRGDRRLRGHGATSAQALGRVERMRAARCRIAVRARRQPGLHPAGVARSSPRRSRRCRSRSASRSIPTRRRSCATSILPDLHSLESWGDAEPARTRSSLQQPAMDPVFAARAPRPTCCIAAGEEGPRTPAQLPAEGLPHVADGALPGRRRRRSPPRSRRA